MWSHHSRSTQFCKLVEINAKCCFLLWSVLSSNHYKRCDRQSCIVTSSCLLYTCGCTALTLTALCGSTEVYDCSLVLGILFNTTHTYSRTTLIMLRLATHTYDVPVFSTPAIWSCVFRSCVSTHAIWSRVFHSHVFSLSVEFFVLTCSVWPRVRASSVLFVAISRKHGC